MYEQYVARTNRDVICFEHGGEFFETNELLIGPVMMCKVDHDCPTLNRAGGHGTNAEWTEVCCGSQGFAILGVQTAVANICRSVNVNTRAEAVIVHRFCNTIVIGIK